MFIRHGDVLLKKIEALPSDGIPVVHTGELVLAEGEITGHRHRLCVANPEDCHAVTKGKVLFFSLTIPSPLKHEDHKTLEIPAGTYERIFEREYSYADEEIRKVQD